MRCPYHALVPARNLSTWPIVASQAGSDANAANGCGAAPGCDLQAARGPPAGPAASALAQWHATPGVGRNRDAGNRRSKRRVGTRAEDPEGALLKHSRLPHGKRDGPGPGRW